MKNNGYLKTMSRGELILYPDDFFDRLIWHSVPGWTDESHFEEALLDIEDGYKSFEQVATEWGLYIVTLKFIMRKMWIR